MATVISGNTGIDKVQDGSIHEADINADVARLGVGQTYVAMSIGTDRSANTDYTNNTGKPIVVIVAATATSTADTITPIVGGVTLVVTNSGVSGSETPVTFIVPSGATYRVNLSNATMYRWTELR